MGRLLEFLNNLKNNRMPYTLEHNMDDAIMVLVAFPSERWEVSFYADQHITAEIFRSSDWCDEDEIPALIDLSILRDSLSTLKSS